MPFEFKNIKNLDLEKIKKEIEEDREFVKKVLEGKIHKEKKELIKTVLFIVESPNKARTIANFFGRPSQRKFGKISAYEVSLGDKQLIIVSTKGHILELTTENRGLYGVEEVNGKFVPIYSPIKRCLNCNYQFTEGKRCPVCESEEIDDAKDRIEALRKLASEVDEVVIGTDPDTEGEYIAYSVYLLIKPFSKEIYRAEFHEVTKHSILQALNNLKEININRVKAQIVRRVEDRWLGFSLSEKLQKLMERENLSAGRVQTPVLGWIVNRYLEYKNNIQYFIKVLAGPFSLIIDLGIKDKKKLGEIIEKLEKNKVTIKERKYIEEELSPLPPYMTSTMLEDAVRILKIGVDKIMRIAQDLFESGLITYHRTDSIRVSPAGIQVAKEYILQKFGEEYFKPRGWGEGGAHECIRPTRPIDAQTLGNLISSGELEVFVKLTRHHFSLYDLIFKRFVQSQMPSVKVKKIVYTLEIPSINYTSIVEGILEVLKDGWNLVDDYRISSQKIEEVSGEIEIKKVIYWKASKVKLYTQADVINLMREKKIGRPSTYATIVSKILRRGYVVEVSQKLIPTKLGIYVYSFLNKKYGKYVSEERTRLLEQKMDIVEEGLEDYQKILRQLYEETLEIINQKDTKEELLSILKETDKVFGLNKRKRKVITKK